MKGWKEYHYYVYQNLFNFWKAYNVEVKFGEVYSWVCRETTQKWERTKNPVTREREEVEMCRKKKKGKKE